MITIYDAPEHLTAPEIIVEDLLDGTYEVKVEQHVNDVIEFCKKHGNGKLAGTEVKFAYADGHARYVVYTESPIALIHLKVQDSWEYPVHRMSVPELKNYIQAYQMHVKLFN